MTSFRLSWLWLAGALVAGITGGALWPPPPTPELDEHEISWSLPPVSDLQRHVAQDHEAVIRDIPWNARGAVGAEEDKGSTRWRLVGIIREQSPVILVTIPAQPGRVQRVHIGEPLPDESVLDAIEHDQVLIRRGECITTWHLFHPQPTATSEACQESETPPEGSES